MAVINTLQHNNRDNSMGVMHGALAMVVVVVKMCGRAAQRTPFMKRG